MTRLIVLLIIVIFFSNTEQVWSAKDENTYSRIISLYPAHSENLVSLGACDKLIGISTNDNYPPEILDKPRYSYREDPEKFIAADPDLVLIRPMIEQAYPQFVQKLRDAGIVVVSIQPRTVEELYAYWQNLANLVGTPEAGLALKTEFQDGLQLYRHKLASTPTEHRPKVYFEAIHRRMKTFSPDSIAHFALKEAGGISIAQGIQVRNTNIADYGKEHILSHAHEIDVFLAQKGRMNPVEKATIMEEPGFAAIKAVQGGQVYLIEEELVSRPTLRILEGIKDIHQALYPQSMEGRNE